VEAANNRGHGGETGQRLASRFSETLHPSVQGGRGPPVRNRTPVFAAISDATSEDRVSYLLLIRLGFG